MACALKSERLGRGWRWAVIAVLSAISAGATCSWWRSPSPHSGTESPSQPTEPQSLEECSRVECDGLRFSVVRLSHLEDNDVQLVLRLQTVSEACRSWHLEDYADFHCSFIAADGTTVIGEVVERAGIDETIVWRHPAECLATIEVPAPAAAHYVRVTLGASVLVTKLVPLDVWW